MAIEAQRNTKPRTRTDKERAADDRALLASGEPLSTLAQLAVMLGVSVGGIRYALKLAGAPVVRFVRATPESPVMYSVADIKAAVEPQRREIEERQRRAQAQEAAERAAADARRGERTAAHAVHVDAKSARSRGAKARRKHTTPLPPLARSPSRPALEPEVIVTRSRLAGLTVRVVVDLAPEDHALLTAAMQHAGKSEAELIADALRCYSVHVPRPGEP